MYMNIYLDQHIFPVLKILTQRRWSALISLASSQAVEQTKLVSSPGGSFSFSLHLSLFLPSRVQHRTLSLKKSSLGSPVLLLPQKKCST